MFNLTLDDGTHIGLHHGLSGTNILRLVIAREKPDGIGATLTKSAAVRLCDALAQAIADMPDEEDPTYNSGTSVS